MTARYIIFLGRRIGRGTGGAPWGRIEWDKLVFLGFGDTGGVYALEGAMAAGGEVCECECGRLL